MKLSIEITLMPLQNDYEEPIKNFIKNLRASDFIILENPLSTQIYGDFDTLIPFLNKEIKRAFGALDAVVLNMKIVKSDRSDYEPDF